jgi:hypothetical protein
VRVSDCSRDPQNEAKRSGVHARQHERTEGRGNEINKVSGTEVLGQAKELNKIRRRSGKKKIMLVSTSAIGLVLVLVSAAWACTIVRGQTVVRTGSYLAKDPFVSNPPESIDNPATTGTVEGDQCGSDHTGGPANHSGTNGLTCMTVENTWAPVTSILQKSGWRQYWHYPGIKPGWTFQAYAVDVTKQGYNPLRDVEYGLFFLNRFRDADRMLICMGNPGPTAEVEIGASHNVKANAAGNISPMTGTIPSGASTSNATTGPAAVCHLSEPQTHTGASDHAYGTNPFYFTILP